MSGKQKRQDEILRIIEAQSVSSHEGLVSLLNQKGFNVGQATISRDLREMGIGRVKGRYQASSSGETETSWVHTFRQKIKKVEAAGPHLIVVRGILGCAPTIAVEVESQEWPELVGVIAGDDTLFFAVKNESDQQVILRRFQEAIHP